MANWCDRCWHDRDMRRKDSQGKGCPLLLIALSGRTPAQWFLPDEQAAIHGNYTCIDFRPEHGGGGGEPRPKPTPPGQGELLPREPYQAVRMLSPLHPTTQEVTTR
jgi:hypothetical protein